MTDRVVKEIANALIVSCQPVSQGPMDKEEHIVAMALAAVAGGAGGLRIEGVDNVRAVCALTDVPVIGLVKRDLADSAVRITPLVEDVAKLADAGATIIAFDATDRPRPTPVEELFNTVTALGCVAMADCASYEEGKKIAGLGHTFIGSTMSGYIDENNTPNEPDLLLVQRWVADGNRVIAEGRYHTPQVAAQALRIGAYAVVVGSAITRVEHITRWFRDGIDAAVTAEQEKPL